jgi:hypothetical protein
MDCVMTAITMRIVRTDVTAIETEITDETAIVEETTVTETETVIATDEIVTETAGEAAEATVLMPVAPAMGPETR